MQAKTAWPRDHLSEAQVDALLSGDRLAPVWGLELWDFDTSTWTDISADLVSVKPDRNNFPERGVHGGVTLEIQRELAWGRDRVRVFVTLTAEDGAYSARFNRGVYVVTTSTEPPGETPVTTWTATGYDLLHLLRRTGPDDASVFEDIAGAGTRYFAVIEALITASGIGVPLRLDQTKRDTLLPAPRTWVPFDADADGANPSWLRMVNDLLEEIGYQRLMCDQDGNLTSAPKVADPSTQPIELVLDTRDQGTDIIEAGTRRRELDIFDRPNAWKYVWGNPDTAPTVANGGVYVVENTDEGPTSQEAVGDRIFKRRTLNAADTAALKAVADREIAEDKRAAPVYRMTTNLMPLMWHRDVALLKEYTPVEGLPKRLWPLRYAEKLEAAGWTEDSSQASTALTLGGGRETPLEPVEVSALGTVTQWNVDNFSSLRVLVDGCENDSPAAFQWVDLDDDSLAMFLKPNWEVGDRVNVVIRNPQVPLVQAKLELLTGGGS